MCNLSSMSSLSSMLSVLGKHCLLSTCHHCRFHQQYLHSVHRMAAATPDSVSSCGSVPGAPPGCSAACNYDYSNCTYKASLQLERTLWIKWEDDTITFAVRHHKRKETTEQSWICPTCVSAKVSSERIPSSTGVAAEGTFEGFLAWVQLNVAQQITLLSEGGPTLITLKWSLT